MPKWILKLPVHHLATQLLLLLAGKCIFELPIAWPEVIALLAFGVFVQQLSLLISERKQPHFSPVALTAGLNVAFMLGAKTTWIYGIALSTGLGQHYLFRSRRGNQFISPAIAGMVAAFLLFPNLSFSTFANWGGSLWFGLAIVLLGTSLLGRAGLAPIPFIFTAAYAVFSLLLHRNAPGTVLVEITGSGFLLFAFFMLVEPVANARSDKFLIAHAVLTALLGNLLPLLFGDHDSLLFPAVLLSGTLMPLWELVSTRSPRERRRALASTSFFLAAVCAIVYFSPWNVIRDIIGAPSPFRPSIDMAAVVASGKPDAPTFIAPPTDSGSAKEIWGAPDSELYQTRWQVPHVIQRPLKKASREPRFTRRPLPEYAARLSPAMLSYDSSYYAGVAVGDINADGYPDVILSRIGRPIAVLINDRRGGFADLTSKVFPQGAPADVEHLALADFNDDSRLDILVVYSNYYTQKPAALFWFDPESEQFVPSPYAQFAAGRRTSGGISVYDLNADKRPDFYISYGVDWYSENPRRAVDTSHDALYVSDANGWTERYGEFFDSYLSRRQYAGMTALFTDFNLDGAVDFLLGNDFTDPSFTLRGRKAGGFDLLGSSAIENNTKFSMSYFPIDVNDDGVFELWENGVSTSLSVGRLALGKQFNKPGRTRLNQELETLEKQLALGKFECAGFQESLVASLCSDATANAAATLQNSQEDCERIASTGAKHTCLLGLNTVNHIGDIPSPAESKYDVDRYPKQLQENVLLQLDLATGRYANIIKDVPAASFTGFTWCAFPFDVDNDGLSDIYLTTGLPGVSHDNNRMLMNHTEGSVAFSDEASAMGVDSENDGRGAAITDMDLDGDGDLIVNNYMVNPEYFENLSGGAAVLIELRSRSANYYGIGASIRLTAGHRTQVRNVELGGHWNVSQPFVQHFGLGDATKIDAVEVRWPGGNVSHFGNFEPGYRYVVYE